MVKRGQYRRTTEYDEIVADGVENFSIIPHSFAKEFGKMEWFKHIADAEANDAFSNLPLVALLFLTDVSKAKSPGYRVLFGVLTLLFNIVFLTMVALRLDGTKKMVDGAEHLCGYLYEDVTVNNFYHKPETAKWWVLVTKAFFEETKHYGIGDWRAEDVLHYDAFTMCEHHRHLDTYYNWSIAFLVVSALSVGAYVAVAFFGGFYEHMPELSHILTIITTLLHVCFCVLAIIMPIKTAQIESVYDNALTRLPRNDLKYWDQQPITLRYYGTGHYNESYDGSVVRAHHSTISVAVNTPQPTHAPPTTGANQFGGPYGGSATAGDPDVLSITRTALTAGLGTDGQAPIITNVFDDEKLEHLFRSKKEKKTENLLNTADFVALFMVFSSLVTGLATHAAHHSRIDRNRLVNHEEHVDRQHKAARDLVYFHTQNPPNYDDVIEKGVGTTRGRVSMRKRMRTHHDGF